MLTPSLFPTNQALVVPGQAFEILSARSWVFRFARELCTPNRNVWRGWRAMAADRAGWERAIRRELHEWLSMCELTTSTPVERRAWANVRQHREHRSLTVTRLVPSTAHFIRDDRNLQFAIKGLEDALVRQGLLVDDRREWLTCAPVTQHVSPDGQFYTVVLLERPAIVGAEVVHGEAQ